MKHKATHRQAWPFALAQKKHFFHFTFLKIYLCISAGKDVAINDDQVTGGVPKVWIVESIRVQVDKTTPNILDPSLGQRTGYWQPYNYLLENYLMANKQKNDRD